jgi:GxxExxY protein
MELLHQDVTEMVIAAAIEEHRTLGPGLLESADEQCRAHALTARSVPFVRQTPLPVVYEDVRLDCGHRMDFLVEECGVVEVKAVDALMPIHEAELLIYLRLSGQRVGLLINFDVTRLKDGIVRRVL